MSSAAGASGQGAGGRGQGWRAVLTRDNEPKSGLQTGRTLEARLDKLRSPARAKGRKQVTGQAKKKSTSNARRS